MAFAGVASMGDFWRVVREFNPEGIEREATASVNVLIAGEPGAGKRTLASSLLRGSDPHSKHSPFEFLGIDHEQPRPLGIGTPDALLLVARLDGRLEEQGQGMAALFGRPRVPTLLVFTHADTTGRTREERNAAHRAFSFVSHLRTAFVDARDPVEVAEKVGPLLLDTLPSARAALARRLPPLRPVVAEQIIAETCRVNAQFALAANLPANLPFVGGIAGGVADFFVLTKNQVMMVLRLGAIYGRDVDPSLQMAGELAPVVGGGILWRSVARAAVGMLPSLLAAAPKTAIAHVGTYVAGQAARYYFDQGRKPPKELLRRFRAEGSRLHREHLAGPPALQQDG
jgi:uncharacterized protein (DUF697 family)